MLIDQLEYQRVKRLLKKVNKWQPIMRQMSDDELKAQTQDLRSQLKKGKTLDQILPQAFATVREADYRILGLFPYDVQVMGAIVLHSGNIAEMKTGEGKTLTATMPLYLNALSGKGAMLVTSNDYLAARDEKQLAPVYNWLGLTSAIAFKDKEDKSETKVTPKVKRAWYAHDIVYTTASSLAFDYLFNNLVSNIDGQFLRPFNYVIIDEVDDVLLDQANSPFVIASSPMVLSELYILADNFVRTLVNKVDFRYRLENTSIWLTYHGVKKAEKYFRIDDLFSSSNRELYRHIILALHAHYLSRKGREYVVENGDVVLLDETNGRLQHGVQVSTGLHQAIQQKEQVRVTPSRNISASITFPSLFGLFNKVAGMSGTAKVDESEFMSTYKMRVVKIPTNKPVIRKDLPRQIYLTTSQKLLHAINYALELHSQGRPILLVAGSMENSEIISEILLNNGIPHNVLNALNEAKEARIVKDAGQKGAVTIATNMAGRGTDIKLGPGVKQLGGLAVIGTEMLPDRVRLQLAGRAGRQGDPGSSVFFISLEDSYISKGSTKRFKRYYRKLKDRKKKDRPLTSLKLKASLAMLQNRVQSKDVGTRKETNKGEIALKIQRKAIYNERQKLMENDHLERLVGSWISDGIKLYLQERKYWRKEDIRDLVNSHFSYDIVEIPDDIIGDNKRILLFLEKLSKKILVAKSKTLITNSQLNQFYRTSLLAALDHSWMAQMKKLDNLRMTTPFWTFAGRDPSYIYQKQAFNDFVNMLDNAKKLSIDNLLLSTLSINKQGELVVSFN